MMVPSALVVPAAMALITPPLASVPVRMPVMLSSALVLSRSLSCPGVPGLTLPATDTLPSVMLFTSSTATGASGTETTLRVVVRVLESWVPLLAASLLASRTCQLMVRCAVDGFSLALL